MISLRNMAVFAVAFFAISVEAKQADDPSPSPSWEEVDALPQEEVGVSIKNEIIVVGYSDDDRKQFKINSSTIVTGYETESLGLQDLRDALKIQANTYSSPSNNGNNGISIRGVNSEGVAVPGANSRPLTTLIIDGAAQSIEGVRRGQRGTWDISEIEVARGPQSTLQGRNTLAGSITVRTNDPSDTWEAAARLSVGQQELFAPALMVSGPLSSEVAFRIAAEASQADKGIEYSDPATSFLDEDEYKNIRGKLSYKPRHLPKMEIKFTISDTLDDPAIVAVTGPDYQERFFDVSQTAAERRRNKVRNHVLAVNYQLKPELRFVSTTAFVETDAYIDGVGTVNSAGYGRDELRSDQDVTQLFRFVYEPSHGPLTADVGLFLGNFKNDRDSLVTVGPMVQQNLYSIRKDKNAAIFGEAWWQFMPAWQLVLGARYEVENTEQATDMRNEGTRTYSDYDNDAFLPKVGIIHDFRGSDSLAMTISTGYRGGFREVDSGTESGRDVAPEFLTSYELAYRSSWRNNKLHFNVSVFHNRWRDQQVTISRPDYETGDGESQSSSVLDTTINAGESHAQGVEFDLSLSLSRVDIGASIGFLQTQFDDLQLQDVNLRGNEFPEAPHMSGGVWAIAHFSQVWFLSADLAIRDSAYATSDIFNREMFRVPGSSVAGLRFGYEGVNLSCIAFVDNVFDRDYIVGRDVRSGYYVGDPLTAGVTLTARY